MGFLTGFVRPKAVTLMRLPAGSFTVDRNGRILATTLPGLFPVSLVDEIARAVLTTFRSAQAAQIPLSELTADFSSLRLTAKELRGGAIVFLTPRGLATR